MNVTGRVPSNVVQYPGNRAGTGRTGGPTRYKASRKAAPSKVTPLYIWGDFDIPFLLLTLALLGFGLVMLFSASYARAYYYKDSSYYYFIRQIVFAVAGLVAMLLMSKINYKILKAIYKPVFVVTIALLVIVLFYHTNVQNFKRWIPLGPVSIQPSDLAKFTIILTLAVYISKYYKKMKTMKYGILIPVGIIAIFCGLIYLEHHLSCTILMFFIGACLMFAGGSDWKLFAFGLAVIVLLGFLVVSFPTLIENYAGKRIVAWLDKDYDPLNGRWQTNNSLYAIGSGGFFGVGLGNSKQKYLYVSEPQNDFIFSIVCEELGFLGAAIIIALFAALVIRGLIIASRCKDKFGSLLIIGVVAQIGLQVVLNILVVTDTLPNTGFALPFFSYGGTAIFMLLFEIGVVLSVSRKTNQQKV